MYTIPRKGYLCLTYYSNLYPEFHQKPLDLLYLEQKKSLLHHIFSKVKARGLLT